MATPESRSADAGAKLCAALAYLGDKLSTHRESRFKPRHDFLLDEWLGLRRYARNQGRMEAGERSRTSERAVPRFLRREALRLTHDPA